MSTEMAVAIHVELDVLCLLILCVVAYQSVRNINQQMSRKLFRYTVYGIIVSLVLDILWILLDGRLFPGAVVLNRVINALYLSLGVILGGIWYLFVLETMGHAITRKWVFLVLSPGAFFLILNVISIWTGWIFIVTEENVYRRGSLFWLQAIGALVMLFVSFAHILVHASRKHDGESGRMYRKLLGFYIIPMIGMLVSLPYSGMPGIWTCAAVSIVLMYIDGQDQEILRDSLTGLNNRKTLTPTFNDYVRQVTPENRLHLFMMDVDDFKQINDTLGHPAGDKALVDAAKMIRKCLPGRRAIVVRFGGDEYLLLGFFTGDEDVQNFREMIERVFRTYNEEEEAPFTLGLSIGSSEYEPGDTLSSLIEKADSQLYLVKKEKKVGR